MPYAPLFYYDLLANRTCGLVIY